MAGHTAGDSVRGLGVFYGTDSKAVVTDNAPAAPTHDIGLGSAGLLIGQCVSLQEAVERFFPAVKSVAVVCRVELLNGRVSLGTESHSSTLFCVMRRARPGFAAGG